MSICRVRSALSKLMTEASNGNSEIKEVKKAVLPMAGLASRFYPISKAVGKELLPLVDCPMISYAVEEAKQAGIEEVILVAKENNKTVAEYFKSDAKLEQFLEDRIAKEPLENLQRAHRGLEQISFSSVVQPWPKGDGDAVLKAEKKVGKEPFAVVFFDDIFVSKTPALTQLINVFQTSQKIVVGLKKASPGKLPFYGVVKAEKIANNLYKIKDVVEKPAIDQAPSDLAVCGRYILTDEIFSYLKKIPPTAKGEIILADAFKAMLADGKIIYGCEIEGNWLECGNMAEWLKSNLTLCLKHPKYGSLLKEWLKKIK